MLWVFYKAGVGGGSFYFAFSMLVNKAYFVYTFFNYLINDNFFVLLCASVLGLVSDGLLLSIRGRLTFDDLFTEGKLLSDFFLFILIIDIS